MKKKISNTCSFFNEISGLLVLCPSSANHLLIHSCNSQTSNASWNVQGSWLDTGDREIKTTRALHFRISYFRELISSQGFSVMVLLTFLVGWLLWGTVLAALGCWEASLACSSGCQSYPSQVWWPRYISWHCQVSWRGGSETTTDLYQYT